ncbi:MAG TPA: hypothetical protein VHH09_06440, partial [Acidimicrobiales bacterium]|nr:hypothetical protein [Acidimicrobiales bacterium]
MFRRKKKDVAEASTSADEAGGAVTTTEGEAEAPPPPEQDMVETPSAAPEPVAAQPTDDTGPAPEPVAAEARSGNGGYDPGYADDGYLPPRVWMESVLDNRPPPSREELARQAEADFQAAISPSLEKLRDVVPDASSPEEARRALEEREREIEFPPDAEGEQLKGRDIFRREASVHYRIQKQLERPRGRVG